MYSENHSDHSIFFEYFFNSKKNQKEIDNKKYVPSAFTISIFIGTVCALIAGLFGYSVGLLFTGGFVTSFLVISWYFVADTFNLSKTPAVFKNKLKLLTDYSVDAHESFIVPTRSSGIGKRYNSFNPNFNESLWLDHVKKKFVTEEITDLNLFETNLFKEIYGLELKELSGEAFDPLTDWKKNILEPKFLCFYSNRFEKGELRDIVSCYYIEKTVRPEISLQLIDPDNSNLSIVTDEIPTMLVYLGNNWNNLSVENRMGIFNTIWSVLNKGESTK